MKTIFYTGLLILLIPSCGLEQRERDLQQREAELAKKEEQLNLRQQSIQAKEADMLKKDSSINSIAVHNDTLPGIWNVQMVCTESSCAGSAVGDTKREQWQVSYQGQHLVARAMSGDQLIRIYTGVFTGNTIELLEDRTATGDVSAAKMIVRLYFKGASTLEGHREILRNDCRVMYSLKADKQL